MTTLLSIQEHVQCLAKSYQEYTLLIRRHLHQHPELSWKETQTIAFLKAEIHKILEGTHLTSCLEEKRGGLILDLTVDPCYDRLLLRADIDALPIQEETDLPFQSHHDGVMHACGHDFHAAMLLGALKAICEHPMLMRHNLRFVWQRAEENPVVDSGGKVLVREGVLKNISKVYGLHITSKEETGKFLSRPGPMMSNSSHLHFKIKCMGGHVMHPDKGSNAIDIMTDIHMHLRGLILSSLGPKEPISFVPSISHAGAAPNIMPNQGYATYSFRNFLSHDKRTQFIQKLNDRLLSLIRLYPDARLESFEFCPGHPLLENYLDEYEISKELLVNQGFITATTRLMFSGEDFAYYLQKCPGCFWLLGAAQGQEFDHHTSLFNPNEEVLWMGVLFWILLASAP